MEISSNMPMGMALFKTQVALSVQKLSMENIEQNTDALRQLLEQSVAPHLGSNFDMKG
jgi:hypothetical protein